ncbi:PREDICTED: uncharacterized protein LOC104739061 [Camelina sativa]|uniref:Uncharacterized protein LOC104739061 n=1 Tax=Camelina sativa TaxID=90675 RepID=A0ABM0VKK0_CAMSA|nr:PREDICTED: uncharacterized protein LOC104739061 [Camelina sativa]
MCLPSRPVSKTHSFSSSSSTIATRMINCILLFAFIFLVYLLISASRLQSKNSIHAYFSSSDQDQSKSLTKINHIVFGLGSSTNSWPARREYVKLWWDAQKMRGCVFVDHPLSSSENHTDSDLLPPICISQDTSRFRYTWRGGDRNAIRIARCVLETVRLFNASSEEVRWYVFGDDDTIFIPENLARTLSKYDHTSWYYIGSNSETYQQNSIFGHDMAFGGGGFALSSSLANVLARNFDSCIERYPHLYGGDSRVHVCVLELGVQLSREPGFHQFDVRGNALGILTSHSTRPMVSLHHMAHIDPIFPNSTTFSAVSHLFSAVELDPLRIFQLSVCYDRWYSWTISVSWGYTVQIDSRHLLLPVVLRTQETFRPWGQSGYTFNTREIHSDPCQRPVTFYMQHVSSSRHNGTIESVYTQAYENCTYDPITSPRKIQEIRVYSKRLDLDIRQLKAPRRQCCDILPTSSTGGKVMEIGLRECKENELIYMHP